jgi:hypothetical protein
MKSLHKKAQEWRNKWKNKIGEGGVVVFFEGKVESWIDELRNPESYAPGCIAVDGEGNQWKATGGDSYNGANEWVPIKAEAWESIQHCYVSF